VYIVSGVLGVFFVPFYPLTYAFLKEIFKAQSVVKFSNLSEVSFQVSGAIALFASGFVYKKFNFEGIVAISVCCLFISSTLMSLIKEPSATVITKEVSAATDSTQNQKMSTLKLTFGFFHLIPQVVLLLLNIPTLIYVEKVMGAGPVEYGVLDSMTALSATLISFVWAYYSSLSSRILTFVVMGVGAVLMLLLLGSFYTDQFFFPFLAFSVLGVFLVSFKMMSRSQLMLTHTAQEVAKYSLYYQLLANVCIVAGAFGMASLLHNDNGQRALVILAFVTFLFLIFVTPILNRLRLRVEK
jgi:hypothetical protein